MGPVAFFGKSHPHILDAILSGLSWPELESLRLVAKHWRRFLDDDYLARDSVKSCLEARNYAHLWRDHRRWPKVIELAKCKKTSSFHFVHIACKLKVPI